MSRTDKDLPYWYAEYYEPYHFCSEFGSQNSFYNGACDLPPEPIVQSPNHYVKFSRRVKDQGKVPAENWRTRCGWEPVSHKYTKQWYNRNPGWWYHDVWDVPARRRVRDESRKALLDYNTNGDTEVDIANFRRKHHGGWFW